MRTNMTHLKSPLRYPGGKSRAVAQILPLMPKCIDLLVSPFFGGGSVELAAASHPDREVGRVDGYDTFYPLTAFWDQMRGVCTDGTFLDQVRAELPLSRERFYALQGELRQILEEREAGEWDGIRDFEPVVTRVAALFFVLNRASFSGTTLSGGMSPGHPRFNEACIRRLEHMMEYYPRGMSCPMNEDAFVVLEKVVSIQREFHRTVFVYADPPYAIEGALYGDRGDTHKGFDHERLAGAMHALGCDWLLSYNDCPEVREWYADCDVMDAEWAYGMNASRKSSEVLIRPRRDR